MSADSSPGQTPTVASMNVPRSQRISKSSPLASPTPIPPSPETATFANTSSRKASDTGKPLPPVISESSSDSNPNKRLVPQRGGIKARDLLRQHYGMALEPPPVVPGRPDDPMDIDSKAFDVKAYYEQLITTTNLTGLLKKENELSAEIRRLDGERQSLVYNHHHELIAASDTIGAMKARADTLDSDLDKLRMTFSEISRLTAEVTRDEESHLAR